MTACPVCGGACSSGAQLGTGHGITLIEGDDIPMWTNDSDEAIYVDASKTHVVPGDSPDVAYLLVAAHGEIPEADAERCGLIEQQRRRREEVAAMERAELEAAIRKEIHDEYKAEIEALVAEIDAFKATQPVQDKAVKPEANK